jgi:hypothetical protein
LKNKDQTINNSRVFMKKVISFSLWGNNPKYTIGAIKNSELMKLFFPDWTCRIYVDSNTVPVEIINELIKRDVEIVYRDSDGWNGMFWRFDAIMDSDIALSRDCDSRISERERVTVEQWLNSGKKFHIIRDHPWHRNLILGGMWGARDGILKNINELISGWTKTHHGAYGTDESFLGQIIYPIVKNDAFIHDEFFTYEPTRNKIPHNRLNGEHIGGIFDENDNPKMEDRRPLL